MKSCWDRGAVGLVVGAEINIYWCVGNYIVFLLWLQIADDVGRQYVLIVV